MKRRLTIFATLIALLFSVLPILQSPVYADCGEQPTPSAPTTGLKGAITADAINVRSEPNEGSASLVVLHRNDVVMVVGRNASGTWAQVQSGDITGWVGSAYVTMLQGKFNDVPVAGTTGGGETTTGNTGTGNATGLKGAITADAVNVRSEPNEGSASLVVVHKNDVVMVIGKNASGTWAQVQSGNVTGWIGSAYVVMLQGKFDDVPVAGTTTGGETTTGNTGNTGTGNATGLKGAITADSVVVRSEPSTSADNLATLHRNDVVLVIGKNAGGTWAQVQTGNITGWVGSAYVVMLQGKFDDVPVAGTTNNTGASATQEAAATEQAAATEAATLEATEPAVQPTDCPPTPAPSGNNGGGATAGQKGAITADAIIVRSQPSTGADNLGTLHRNDVVMVLGRNASGTWAKIQSGNITGWVGSAYVTMLQGKFNDLPVTD